MRSFVKGINWLNEKIGYGVSWLTAVLVVVVCYDVFSRYLLKSSIVAVQELQWHLFATIFLIGAAYTLKHNGHVRVDVFYTRFSEKAKTIVDFVGSLVFLVPFALVVIWSSQNFVENAIMFNETSPDPGGLPARYILKGMIPAGFFLLFLQGLALACQSLLKILSSNGLIEQDPEDSVEAGI